ncbi:MAG: glycosyltransferase family 2 protein [Oscillospiraceae bacterium]|nr:glycosyltransferase family 2 protein [Oscillospiraceae bacterium]
MIEILLAAYNGERYIREQVQSILDQTFTDWHLTAADDGSADSTYDILLGYAADYPHKISVYRNDPGTGSSKANFMSLLGRADADIIAFSDQDDVWDSGKLALIAKRMDMSVPMLIHTDARVVSSDLTEKAPSFMAYQGLDPRAVTLNKLLAQNNVTGCTMAINRKLMDIVRMGIPGDMLMHDWWAALAAAAFGRILCLPDATVSYRQHEDNVLGAVNNRSVSGVRRIMSDTDGVKARLRATFTQAQAFYETYRDMLPDDKKQIIEAYLAIPDKGKISRVLAILKGGYTKQNFMSAIGQIIYC